MSITKLRYTILLRSDTCCGSGTGNGSDVDINASSDNYGLPMIPAKRLRGILRENAMLMTGKYGQNRILSLFGESGVRSRLRVDDARLSFHGEDAETIGQALLNAGYSRPEISLVFTEKRVQTAIVPETGTTKKGSLRTIEVIRRGTRFCGEAAIENADETDIELLKNAFKLTTAIGLDRMRGLGWVSCEAHTIETNAADTLPAVYEPSGITETVTYTIELLQDTTLSLNSPLQNQDYIGGSVIQGALAALFQDKPYFDTVFFGDLKCGNAYISDGTQFFAPRPFSLVSVKNEAGIYDLADGYARLPDKQYVSGSEKYIFLNGNDIYWLSPKTGSDYHINLGISDKAEKNFYSNEKLCKGQIFCGTLTADTQTLVLIRQAMNSCNEILRIGSSISSQYGKCRFHLAKTEQQTEKNVFSKGDTIVAELLSDTILIDGNGYNTTESRALLTAVCGDAGEIKSDTDGMDMIYVKNGTTGGWSKTYGMPKMQYRTFLRGSVLVFTCMKDTEGLPQWIGIGNAEGYGQVRYRKTAGTAMLTAKKAVIQSPQTEHSIGADSIICAIQKRRIEESLRTAALQDTKKAKLRFGNTLSNSAAMRILQLLTARENAGMLFTPETFAATAKSYEANTELKNLTDTVISAYQTVKKDRIPCISDDGEAFTLYLRCFIGRYKELHTEEQNQQEGGTCV